MLKKFIPNLYLSNYKKLSEQWLVDHQIELLLCDIDNTLVAHDEAKPNQETKEFIQKIQDLGIKVALISNNTVERVTTFSEGLNVPIYPFAKKPLKHTYKKILKDFNVEAKRVVCVGDQLLTDVFGGNRIGAKTVLCEPLVQKDLFSTKINRMIENIILKYLAKTGQFKKEIQDEKM